MARLLSRLRMARATAQQHVAKAETALAKRRERLAVIEAAIFRLTPELPLDAVPRQPNPMFARNELRRLTLDILREALEPVPVIVITMRALASKGFVLPAPKLRRTCRREVFKGLVAMQKRRLVVKEGWGTTARWRIS